MTSTIAKKVMGSPEDFQGSYEFLQTVLDSAPYPILVTGLDSSVRYVNPSFEKLTGFTVAELTGQKCPYPWWPPEKIPEYNAANDEGRKKDLNKLLRIYFKKNGEYFWAVVYIAPVRSHGNTLGFIANWVDVTERKRTEAALQESETRFRMLSENSLSGIYIFRHGRLSYVNLALAEMLGRSREELTTCELDALVHPEDREALNENMQNRLRGEQTHIPYTCRCLRGDGKIIWLEMLATRFEDEGRPSLLGTVLDITEQRQAEEEADRLRQIMAQVSRVNTLGELAASLAHELNQPLTAIMINAKTALRLIGDGQGHNEEIKGILKDIAYDDKRAGEIIRKMREPLKRGTLASELLDIRELVKEIYPMVKADAALAGVTIDLNLASGLPRVRGDRTQIQQILLNLVVNALDSVKGLTAGHRWIEIRTAIESSGYLKIEVSDSGPGILEVNRKYLFIPLYTTKPEGLGIGLSICKNLVEAQGGRIWQENRPEGGARFTFTLPAEPEIAPKSETCIGMQQGKTF
jgi:PAS domain S-box-containing protein